MKTEFEFSIKGGELESTIDFDNNTVSFVYRDWDGCRSDCFKIDLDEEVNNLKNFKQMLGLLIDKYEGK